MLQRYDSNFPCVNRTRRQPTSSRSRCVRPALEVLEDRCLPSGTPASVPQPGESPWQAQEQQLLSTPRDNPQIVFLGDSILDLYQRGPGAPVWNSQIAPLQADDFAISGSTTQNILWQLADGQLRGISPRVVVLMIGINNLTALETPQEVADGISACVTAIHTWQPQATVLLLGVLPRAPSPQDPIRASVNQTNYLISQLDNGTNVRFLNLGAALLQPDGSILPATLYDYTHPSTLGYQILSNALVPVLEVLEGGPAWRPVAGDWTGHGGSGIGVVDPSGTWYLRNEPNAGPADVIAPFPYGLPGWIPVVGDWDGNGTFTIGMYDPSTATWYLRNSNSPGPADYVFQYGVPGWLPVVGDWNGEGHTSIGVVDPATMTWYLRNEVSAGPADAVSPFAFGAIGWTPVTGDWNGTGHSGIGTVDPATMTWYLRNEDNSGPADAAKPFGFGALGWNVVVGDWNNDHRTTIGAVNSNGTWYLRNENSGGPPDIAPFNFGLGISPPPPPLPQPTPPVLPPVVSTSPDVVPSPPGPTAPPPAAVGPTFRNGLPLGPTGTTPSQTTAGPSFRHGLPLAATGHLTSLPDAQGSPNLIVDALPMGTS
jgi:lysophospholipase L1-like esterase